MSTGRGCAEARDGVAGRMPPRGRLWPDEGSVLYP